eukprot:1667739-Lingulodinium_polyedra.AAC.1
MTLRLRRSPRPCVATGAATAGAATAGSRRPRTEVRRPARTQGGTAPKGPPAGSLEFPGRRGRPR